MSPLVSFSSRRFHGNRTYGKRPGFFSFPVDVDADFVDCAERKIFSLALGLARLVLNRDALDFVRLILPLDSEEPAAQEVDIISGGAQEL